MECPKCRSPRMFYITRTYQYWTFIADSTGNLSLLNMDESVVDEEFSEHAWCENCGTKFKPNSMLMEIRDEDS